MYDAKLKPRIAEQVNFESEILRLEGASIGDIKSYFYDKRPGHPDFTAESKLQGLNSLLAEVVSAHANVYGGDGYKFEEYWELTQSLEALDTDLRDLVVAHCFLENGPSDLVPDTLKYAQIPKAVVRERLISALERLFP